MNCINWLHFLDGDNSTVRPCIGASFKVDNWGDAAIILKENEVSMISYRWIEGDNDVIIYRRNAVIDHISGNNYNILLGNVKEQISFLKFSRYSVIRLNVDRKCSIESNRIYTYLYKYIYDV